MLFFVRQNQVPHLPPPREADRFSKLEWQGSSVVEQRTHKPFVGSSILPPATIPPILPCESFLQPCCFGHLNIKVLELLPRLENGSNTVIGVLMKLHFQGLWIWLGK